ncbi:hypothetical protein M0R89_21590 (plasmid) [Halorussus limi]|uniref:Halobacterial output domain-containing protein n=1 Tax=Halorussus limi TaxID=2938695 RepID=A0A8U0I1J2_9EURY|nr:HalOD1 output domain-containing protein [Halorussus limi]UPV76786.1 hypothetical protein M0R89_21590 [Halorussus limi]
MGSESTTHEPPVDEERAPGSLGTRVCLALAEEENVHPWESPPLYDVLDPSVLEALDGQENEAWRLAFEAGTHTVVVTGDGDVTVDGTRFTDRDFREALDSLDEERRAERPRIR